MTGLPSPRRHLHVDSGPLHLDYHGPAEQVLAVAAELTASGTVTVRVDTDIRPEHRALPCGGLWPAPGPETLDREPPSTPVELMEPAGSK